MCDACDVDNEVEQALEGLDLDESELDLIRNKAKAKCKAACTKKCPVAQKCTLPRFEEENQEDYLRRCEAATSLEKVTAAREKADIDDESSFVENFDVDEIVEEVTLPEDSW